VVVEVSTNSLIKEAKAFHLKKRLGQHFLVDVEALQTIVSALGATTDDTIVEVGPGIGFLTRFLSEVGARVVAIELDRESVERLRAAKYPNVEIKHGDFLRFDLNIKATAEGTMKIVGNVPYQITGLIIGHLLGELDKPSPWLHRIKNIVLTVQYEVAQRIVAKPGESEYSRLSILSQQYCETELVQRLPASAFYTPPEVNSAIVRMTPLPQPAVTCSNMTLMRQLVQAGFRQRRKMFRNALGFLRLPQSTIDSTFARLSMDPQVRAERLSLKQFAMLADAFNEIKSDAKTNSSRAGEDQSDV
jgi:16S rRNA (adenine1518-N6/adenine1519-N6)-dimethyltransferase